MNREKTSFNEACWEILKQIPPGKVTTYGDIAKALNSTGYRAVGNAMNKNPYAPEVPCHRVVRANGELGGYAFGGAKKVELLLREGIRVENGKVLDFQEHHFIPKSP